ncbi:serine/threonine protein kinase [Solirubrobacter ginsenosidimutans]|uniref:non-specific serine/threonine protein kinase n=1 Tax=Solirubrobacter ginsenosidimutans TaxID=490573 RepID=A0A9X3S5I0_9ACTN|nr:serine/threonine-protein kinase [Solirubrobacter ginsenosidimutans]MDA0164191.1 serine/threonine protein kinase [Solirubrobacter ginsenosidimutans]
MTDVLEGAHIAGCRIEAVAGRGGMGIVYRATQLSLGRPVALKLIAPEHAADAGFRERFQRESRMAAAIDHPNVIPVYEAGEEDGRLYLVMRWVAGTDLHRLLRAEGRVEPQRAAEIVNQVAGALDAAHEAGLIHRDVKPANVLLSGEHAYLADFGLTRFAGADTLTTAGHFLGTVDYMAPEQFHPGPNDARADVYALGCVLYAALTGAPPFLRETVPATMLAHLHDQPPQASRTAGVPPGFDRVLARALAKSPEDRYPSAGDFGRAVLAAAEGRSVTEEERSVARGAAAPTIRREGRLWSGVEKLPPVGVPDPVAEQEPPAPAETTPIRRYRAKRRRRLWAWGSGVVAIAGAAVAIAVVPGGADTPKPGEPVSSGEVERMANSFASAYGDEDAARMSRLLTADAQRVSPTDNQTGRHDVVAAYQSQFNSKAITGFELKGLSAESGPSGRATARYTITYDGAKPTTGQMTWVVISEKGRPRISLIAFVPD